MTTPAMAERLVDAARDRGFDARLAVHPERGPEARVQTGLKVHPDGVRIDDLVDLDYLTAEARGLARERS